MYYINYPKLNTLIYMINKYSEYEINQSTTQHTIFDAKNNE